MNYVYLGTLLFILGCYTSLEWWYLKEDSYLLLAGVLFCFGCACYKELRKFWKAIICCSFLFLGMWAGANAPTNPKEQLQPYFKQQVLAYGSIVPESVKRYSYGTSFVLKCEHLRIGSVASDMVSNLSNWEATPKNESDASKSKATVENGQQGPKSISYKQKLRVFTKNKDLPSIGKLWCQGELLPLNTLRNPGTFNGERWNYLQGLGGRLRKTRVQVVSNEGSFLDKLAVFNMALRERVSRILPDERGALLCGMLLGGSAGLSDETREAFAANGLAHILSVSGTHFALLAGFLLLLLQPLPTKLRKLIVLALLFVYALVCGLKPPIVRALCMSAVVIYGGSGSARGNLLCLVAMIMLCFRPAWLLDLGFQLSFGAVGGLIWLYPKLKNYFCAYLPIMIGEGMAITMAAQLSVLPFLVGHFHQLPLISLISNIFLIPILELAGLLTLLGIALEFILPIGESFIVFAGWLVQQIIVQAKFLASLPFSTLVVGAFPLWCAVAYYFALIIWADLPCVQFLRNRERRFFLLGSSFAIGCMFLWKQFVPIPLTAYFLEVGQGDCAVVLTPSRKVIVIDTGGMKNFDTGSKVLVPFLRSLGKSKVDALILSHMDHDHAGGAVALARNMRIERIILPTGNGLSESEEALLRKAKCDLVERASVGKEYDFDGAVLKIEDVPRPQNIYKPEGNEASTVTSIKYGRYSLLFTGDIDAAREHRLLDLGNYDVLKVAHHGSKHSSSLKFLQQVQPKVAVISVGEGNRYGHPHVETLQRLASVGSSVLRTDELGAVKVVFEDEGMRCFAYTQNDYRELQINNF